MRSLKTRFRKLWYIGLGAVLALVPTLVVMASDGNDSD